MNRPSVVALTNSVNSTNSVADSAMNSRVSSGSLSLPAATMASTIVTAPRRPPHTRIALYRLSTGWTRWTFSSTGSMPNTTRPRATKAPTATAATARK